MNRLLAAFIGLVLITAAGLAVNAQNRLSGDSIRDRIRDRMEQRRLERVPQLGGAATLPGVKPGYESLVIRGQPRTFKRYTPNRVLVSGKRAPLVVALHGDQQTADDAAQTLGLNELADREGFIVVYPQAVRSRWNDGSTALIDEANAAGMIDFPDDLAFLNGLADALVAQGVADSSRLYLMGVSTGGMMTLAVACSDAPRYAAFVPVSASLSTAALTACKPTQPTPVLMINGTEDTLVRFDGQPGALLKADSVAPLQVAERFAAKAACASSTVSEIAPAQPDDKTSVAVRLWTQCKPGVSVAFYTITGGGHPSPAKSAVASSDPSFGVRSHAIDTAEVAWTFFKTLTR